MHTAVRRQRLCVSLPILFLIICCSWTVCSAQDDPERARAFQLYEEAKYTEALPVFEKLAAKYAEDRDVLKTYGFLMIGQGAYLKDADARKEARRRGRELLVKAQKLGEQDALLKSMLESIPADGGNDAQLSAKKEAEDARASEEKARLVNKAVFRP